MTNSPLPTPTPMNEWRKYNTLIVDDDLAVLEQIEDDIFESGFNCLKASSAEEGLEIIEQQAIHVVLTDQKMPGGMNGTQFLTEVRRRRPHTVGIILSAFQDSDYVLDALNKAKAFSYLLKPWSTEELIECLRQALQLTHSSRLGQQDQAHFQGSLLEQCQKSERKLQCTQSMLTEAVQELNQTQMALMEATDSLATISDVAAQLSGKLKSSLRERMSFASPAR